MINDWDDYIEEDETQDLVNRYMEMKSDNAFRFFDLCEFDILVDYFIERYDYDEALNVALVAIEQHPYAATIRLKYAQVLIETGKPARALGILRSIEKAELSNFELHLAKGMAYNLTGKCDKALLAFDRAIRLCTENRDEVAYAMAQSFVQIGRFSTALKYLLLAHEINSGNLLVLYDLAVNYEQLDYPDKSIEYYHKFLAIDPFAEHVWNNLGLIYSNQKEYTQALDAFDYAIAINPNYYTAYFNKADLMLIRKKINLAISVYIELLEQDGQNTRALCYLGDCYEESGNYLDALKTYSQAIQITDDCSDAWFGKGLVHFKQRKFSKSITAIKKALSIEPDNADYWFMLGEVFNKSRNADQAIRSYTRAAQLNPYDYEAWLACAQIFFRKRQIGEAINMLIQSYKHNNDNSTLNYRLAAYHYYLNDYKNAYQYFDKGLKLNFNEYNEMFRLFPKTKSFTGFRGLIESHLHFSETEIKIKLS